MSDKKISQVQDLSINAPVLVEIIRKGKVIHSELCYNLMPEQGRNYVANTALRNQTPVTTLSMGLFEGNYTPADNVTAATISAASTECTAYDETTRRTVTYSAASASAVNNSAAPCTFTINATKTIYGMFIASDSAKGGTAGVLTSVIRFATPKSVVTTDVIQVTHTVTLAST